MNDFWKRRPLADRVELPCCWFRIPVRVAFLACVARGRVCSELGAVWFLLFSLVSISGSFGQGRDESVTLDDVIKSTEQWAQENLDDDALRLLQSADQKKVKQLLADLQREFQGQYVLDLAALRDVAKEVVPLLEQYEETYPYAIWLKTRLDYLEVAEQLKLIVSPPKTEPGKPPKTIPNPPPQKERETWIAKLTDRALPKIAQSYVGRLKPIFIVERVPPELVWMAEVESSFDPRARSPAGAAGLFQLMPATARRYGLKTVWPWDERLQPEPSARAAAQYLQHLHLRFKDWRLALAAYNAGEGTVQELLTRQKAVSYDAIAARLPAETQMYVPKIEATLFRREGLRLAQLQAPRKR